MIRIVKSGKFWLKLVFYSSLISTLLGVASYAVLQHLFSAERIHSLSSRMLAGSGRQLHFDDRISRSWLPRPTVTLYQVRLSNPHSEAADIDVGRMQIGLAWSSLFGQPSIEKWVWEDALLRLYRDEKQQWNLSDLWQRWQQQPKNHININRLILRQARLHLTDAGQYSHRIDNINALIRHFSESDNPFEADGTWQRQNWPQVHWKIQGQHRQRQWQNIRLNVTTTLPHLGESNSQWQFNGVWQPHNNSLLLQQVQWQWQSPQHRLNINGSGQRWQLGDNGFDLPQANALISLNTDDSSGNATLLLNRLHWQNQHGSLAHFQFNGGWQSPRTETLLSTAGSVHWTGRRWQVDDLNFSSHQDTDNHLPNPRWMSDLSGSASGQGLDAARLELSGTFDNQLLDLNANYADGAPATLSGSLNLNQLSLRPYWPQNNIDSAFKTLRAQWQRWLQGRKTDWHVRIGRVLTPWGQMDDFGGHLRLDAQELLLDNMHAQLYGGVSQGRLRIGNQNEPEWQLEQQLERIQIKPLLQDALNFHNLDGRGDARFRLSGRDWSNDNWAQRLNGDASLQLQQGSWRGIDINNILQRSGSQNATLPFNEQSQTPFRHFEIDIPIRNGIGHSQHILLNADNFNINGAGTLDFVQNQIDYGVLVHTHQRGGASTQLPLKISGPLARPAFALDFERLTRGLETPEQKQQALQQALKQQWQWLNQGSPAASAP